MTRIMEALEAVRALAQAGQTVYGRIVIGALPPDDGMCIALSSGAEETAEMDFGCTLRLTAVLNAKHREQDKCLQALCEAHEAMTMTKTLLMGTGWQISSLRTIGAPSYLDHDGDQYLYGSSIEIRLECEQV